MKTRFGENQVRGWALVDGLVVIVILLLLAGLLLPSLAAAQRKAARIQCMSNLHEILVAERLWSEDNTNQFLSNVSTNLGGAQEFLAKGEMFRMFQTLSNILASPRSLVCPADTRRAAQDFGPGFSNTNMSYFFSLDANDNLYSQIFLTGDRNLTGGTRLSDGILVLTTNSAVGWGTDMHRKSGNVALVDGSAATYTPSALREGLAHSGAATNRLAVP